MRILFEGTILYTELYDECADSCTGMAFLIKREANERKEYFAIVVEAPEAEETGSGYAALKFAIYPIV